MNDHVGNDDRVLTLAAAVCDENASRDDLIELDAVLLADECGRRRYLKYCRLHISLETEMHARLTLRRMQGRNDLDSATLRPWESDVLGHAVPPCSVSTISSTALGGTFGFFSSGWPVAYLIATVICGIGILIGAAMHVSRPTDVAESSLPAVKDMVAPTPQPVFVGRITGMVDCQWSDPHTAVPGPVAVPLGRKYALSSGLMEITYDTGAKVILQGPCTYEVESHAGGFLSLGKLTARVEKKATNLPSPSGRGAGGEGGEKNGDHNESRSALTLALSQGERGPGSNSSFLIPHSYFAVRTPTATVTDLGTEFGVEVDKEGGTSSRVFRGKVSVQVAGSGKETRVAPLVLHENESVRVAQSGDKCVIVPSPSAEPAEFVRKLVKSTIKTFDLVDVVAGGDGFSGRRNRGIDPADGRVADIEDVETTIGDGKYHSVSEVPFVDGIFIPQGDGSPVQLDSAGHSFASFPATDNKSCTNLWAGQIAESAELGAINYASSGHGLLWMHANKGVTFDLAAIRRANPDCKLLRFRAVVGNTETLSEKGESVYADAWVFVDGRVQFRRQQISRYNGAMPVVVPIDDNDRFLTLVATDGGNGYRWDYIIFGDPRLEMVSAKTPDESLAPAKAVEP